MTQSYIIFMLFSNRIIVYLLISFLKFSPYFYRQDSCLEWCLFTQYNSHFSLVITLLSNIEKKEEHRKGRRT